MTIQSRDIRYEDLGTRLTGSFVWDDAVTEPRPGVLVFHGGAGLDDHALGRAGWLAQLGYGAFACNMYGEGVAGSRERVMRQISELRGNPENLRRRALAGLQALAALPEVRLPAAAVGYCFGGMCVLELARSGVELVGAVCVHGTLETRLPAEPNRVKTRVLVCHGALDPHVPMTQVSAFAEEMKEAGADWQLVIYGGAMHGFTHEAGPFLPGVAYHRQADARSRAAIQSFLSEGAY